MEKGRIKLLVVAGLGFRYPLLVCDVLGNSHLVENPLSGLWVSAGNGSRLLEDV